MKNLLKTLPTIEQIYADPIASDKANTLNALLNVEPKPEWLKPHPMAKGVKYIPIERIEFLLTSIFLKWKVEVKEIKLIANSMVAVVRLHYQYPTTGEWEYQDGIGAAPVQTDKGASATDFSKVKNDSIMKAAPAAESYAIKDAAEKLGKIFGKDINRKDEIGYGFLSSREILDDIDQYKEDIENIQTIEDLMEYAKKNSGKGKDVAKLIIKRSKELE